jgi:PAT family beta-lactamase induction signal transducer AmpG
MGFSSGLPLVLTRSTLKAWLTEGRVDLKTVGFFTLVAFPYSFKFIWAPAVDRWAPLGLGRRRGWLIVSQLGIIAGLVALALSEPGPDTLGLVALAAAWTAFFGATQDVVIDAYRRETFPDEELGLASSLFVSSYRVALLAAGGGALYLADVFSWRDSYFVMAGLMAASIAVTLVAPEPQVEAAPPKSLRESAIGPLTDFFKRSGAPTILAFILLYKVGEQMASEMFNPFFIQIGFTKTEIAEVSMAFGPRLPAAWPAAGRCAA